MSDMYTDQNAAPQQYGTPPAAPAPYGYQPGMTGQMGAPALPPSNAGWAVAALVFFWPVAFTAFNHVNDVYPKWAMGDYAGAQHASDRAKALGKIALWVSLGLMALFVVGYGILLATLFASISELESNY